MSIGISAYAIASNDNQICEVICDGTRLISAAQPVHPTPSFAYPDEDIK